MQILLTNAHVLTMDASIQNADTVLIESNKILAVGKSTEVTYLAKANAQKINLNGKSVLPAFIDTHTHFYELARKKFEINLDSAKSLADVHALLEKFANSINPEIEYIGGSGWDKNIYSDLGTFDKTTLDKYFPNTPVAIFSRDYHTILANSKALEKAGINKNTKNPEGGKIGHYPNGEPNGFLYEKAWDFIVNSAVDLPINLQKQAVKLTVEECYQYGIGFIHAMESQKRFDLYKNMVENDNLNFRFCWHFPSADIDEMIAKQTKSYTGNGKLIIGGMKIFMDGSVGSQSAYMYDKYPNTDSYGSMILSKNELTDLVEKAAKKGISSSIHAIGDKCVNIVVDVLASSAKKYPKLMHRIEHLQAINDRDIEVLKNSNIFIAAQPVHIKADIPVLQKQWPVAKKISYRFKTLENAGVVMGFGSDAPVETINPFEGIYAAIERKYLNNPSNKSWQAGECLSTLSALKGYTINAAKASRSEKILGSITPGKLADIIVIDKINFDNAEFWLGQKSLLAIINGEIVYNNL